MNFFGSVGIIWLLGVLAVICIVLWIAAKKVK